MRGCRRPHRADKRRPTPDPRVRPGPGRVMPPPPPKAPCTRRKNRTRALQHAHRHPCGEHARAPKRQEPPGCDTHQRRRWHTGRSSGAGRTANRTPWAGPPQRLMTGSYPHHSNCNRKHGNCLQHRIPQNRTDSTHKRATAQRRSGRSEKGQGQVSVIRPRAGLSTPKKVLRAARAPRANAQTPTVRAWQGARHAHGGGVWGRGRGHLPAPASEEHMQGPASEEHMQRGEREAPDGARPGERHRKLPG